MKNRFTFVSALALMAIASLAACGGGSSGGSVATPPTTQPPVAQGYTAKINFSGDGARAQSFTANLPQSLRSTQATAGGQVVVLTSTDFDTSVPGVWLSGTGSFTSGTVSVQLSPQPSASPSSPPSWSINASGVSFDQNSSVTSAVAPTPQVFPNGINSSGSGTINASQPLPNATPVPASTKYVLYRRLAIACTQVDPTFYGASGAEAHGGVQMINGVPTPTDDKTKADLYFSGPKCWGSYNAPNESTITLHCPSTCQFVSGESGFLTATASLLTTPVSSFPVVTSPTDLHDLSGFVIFKDSAGSTYKVDLNLQNVTNVATGGPYCKFTACPDGS